ncbi:hypothetical protein DESC_970062 [Desulfosarcina cetonica]|nr:hypothetical protein DESC_970062 [Desulfosarcina cetonica]
MKHDPNALTQEDRLVVEISTGKDENSLRTVSERIYEKTGDGTAKLVSETIDDDFKKTMTAVESAEKQPLMGAGKAEAAIEVAKLAWDILKETRPQAIAKGAFTSVLDSREMDPLRYPNAKNFKSDIYAVNFKNVFGTVVAGVKLRCIGTYKAQKPPGSNIPDGDYLPQVAFDVIKAEAAATTSINAVASVTSPANVGTADHVNPQVFVKVDITYSGWFKSETANFPLTVQGSRGVVK